MPTPRFGLTQPLDNDPHMHYDFNDAVRHYELHTQTGVADWLQTTPADLEDSVGEAYIIPAGATGDWASIPVGSIVASDGFSWLQVAPDDGYQMWDRKSRRHLLYFSDSWILKPGNVHGGLYPVVGVPTAFPSSAFGDLIIQGDMYVNAAAFNNPDYVFEKYYTGDIVKFKDNPGAAEYEGLRSLEEVESYVEEHWCLPHIPESVEGVFGRSDKALELIEELHLHVFEMDARLTKIERKFENGAN